MDNKFGGGVFSLNYTANRLSASLGGGLNQYRGNNFGRVPWVKNYVGSLSPDHEYYRNKSKKTDGNIYLKANYDLTRGLSAYADLSIATSTIPSTETMINMTGVRMRCVHWQ